MSQVESVNQVIEVTQSAKQENVDIVEERVKVDRKRFEQMLCGESQWASSGCDADAFFKRVMRSTNTQIMWPPKLKPGTKSKKDPHVRITGSPNSINAAKEIIFEQLDTRRNRVTLKMDVAFTDHSHIIGKGGRSIQRVMDDTGCHIHFPDSNRTNTAEKSNQVSIAGSAEGVEQSRCRIREMLPITFQFDLPLNNGLHSPPTLDPQSPQLQAIQQTYGMTITFRCDGSKCNNSYFASSRIITVAVRGARSHLFGLRQGLSLLIEYLTGFRANTINVPLTMTIDVAVQHHSFIAGRANCNIRSIMQSTGAVITMPETTTPLNTITNTANANQSITSSNQNLTDLSATLGPLGTSASLASTASSSLADLTSICGQKQQSFMTSLTNQTFHGSNPNLASIMSSNNRKTAIVIKGPTFESVYSAWQELLGYLPLILIFDLKEGQDLDAVQVTKLMEQMRQISILIKPKQRQNTKSIVVRGPEKDSRLLFEVRRQILRLDESEVPNFSLPEQSQSITLQQSQPSQQLINQGQQQHQSSVSGQLLSSSSQQSADLQMKAIRAILDPNMDKSRQPTPYWAGLGFSKSVSDPMIKEKLSIGPLFTSNIIDERRISYSNEAATIHDDITSSSLQSLSIQDQQNLASKIFTDINNNNNNNTNNNINNNNLSIISSNNSANEAASLMDKKPSIVDLNNNTGHRSAQDTTNHNNQGNVPINPTPVAGNHKISSCLRLAVFLGRIGLVQYLGLFTQHDIDLEMLFSLNENDFAELGLPYIHRRKLAIAIAEVKSSRAAALPSATMSSTFDAAPGAERSRRQKGDLSDIWSN